MNRYALQTRQTHSSPAPSHFPWVAPPEIVAEGGRSSPGFRRRPDGFTCDRRHARTARSRNHPPRHRAAGGRRAGERGDRAPRRSATSCPRRSPSAAPRCATSCKPTANPGISNSGSWSMAVRANRADSAAPRSATPCSASGRPTGAPTASTERAGCANWPGRKRVPKPVDSMSHDCDCRANAKDRPGLAVLESNDSGIVPSP